MGLDITSTITALLLDGMKGGGESDKLVASATSATSTDGLHLDKEGLVRYGTRFSVPNNKDLCRSGRRSADSFTLSLGIDRTLWTGSAATLTTRSKDR